MTKFFYLLGITCFISLVHISCDKEGNEDADFNTCNVSDPAVELDWLKASIDEIEQNNDEFSKFAYFRMAT